MPARGLPSPVIVSYPAVGAQPAGQMPLPGPDVTAASAPAGSE